MHAEQKTHKIDRSTWLPGPWDCEPDRVDFERVGFPCLLLRNPSGAWCGYVGVPPGHPDYDRDYAALDEEGVSVHGGLTYCGRCAPPICHTPKLGEPDDVYWFGFDTAHAGDVIPNNPEFSRYGVYRDANYVRAETEQLATQLRHRQENRV